MPPFKTIPSLWSKLRYIKYSVEQIFVGVEVWLLTKILSLPALFPKIEQRLRLIYKLHKWKFSNKDIARLLIQHELRSPRGGLYTPKLIWVTLKKYKLRHQRTKETHYTMGAPSFYLREFVRDPTVRGTGYLDRRAIRSKRESAIVMLLRCIFGNNCCL